MDTEVFIVWAQCELFIYGESDSTIVYGDFEEVAAKLQTAKAEEQFAEFLVDLDSGVVRTIIDPDSVTSMVERIGSLQAYEELSSDARPILPNGAPPIPRQGS